MHDELERFENALKSKEELCEIIKPYAQYPEIRKVQDYDSVKELAVLDKRKKLNKAKLELGENLFRDFVLR